MEMLSQAKEGEALFSNIYGEIVPYPLSGLQTSSVLTFGKGGRQECLQASVSVYLPSSLLGGADFVLTVG